MVKGRTLRRSKTVVADKYNIDLAHVIGSTAKSSCSCSCDSNSGYVAYPAGCTVVLYNPRTGLQAHIISSEKKQIRSLHFSSDGQYLVTGEQGSKPSARIYSVAQRQQLVELEETFNLEISCIKFSPDMKHIVGIGSEHDRAVQVWAAAKKGWRGVWCAKMNQKTVEALAFSPDSGCCIMVGKRYIKLLTLAKSPETKLERRNSSSNDLRKEYVLRGIMLGDCKFFHFVDVGFEPSGKFAYAIASGAIVKISIQEKAVMESVKITDRGQSLNVVGDRILWGTASGKLKLQSCGDMKFIKDVEYTPRSEGRRIICSLTDTSNNLLYLFFDDRTLETYLAHDYTKPIELYSLLTNHSESLWDVKCIPRTNVEGDIDTTTFASCSADGTAMIWKYKDNKCELVHRQKFNCDQLQNTPPPIATTDELITPTITPSTSMSNLQLAAQTTTAKPNSNNNNGGGESTLPASGCRSLAVSPDGKTMAVGDFSGVVSLFDTESRRLIGDLQSRTATSAIQTLAFFQSQRWPSLFGSAGRDRVVNILDENFRSLFVLNDHSSTITGVQFFELDDEVRLITCGFDRSLHFYSLTRGGGKEGWQLERYKQKQINLSVTCMAVTCDGNVYASSGSCVQEYDARTTEMRRQITIELKFSQIMCLAVDQDNTLLAAASGKEGIFIHHLLSNQTIACLKGHSEHANAMSFDGDHRLLSVAGDGCLFVWNIRRTANGAAEGANNPAQAAGATNHDAALCLTPTDALAPSIALPSMPLNQADAVSVPQDDALVPQGDAMLVHDLIRQLHDNSSTKQAVSTLPTAADENEDEEGAELKFGATTGDVGALTPPLTHDDGGQLTPPLPQPVTRAHTLPRCLSVDQSGPLGKWGQNLHKDKVCQVIESLPAYSVSSAQDTPVKNNQLVLPSTTPCSPCPSSLSMDQDSLVCGGGDEDKTNEERSTSDDMKSPDDKLLYDFTKDQDLLISDPAIAPPPLPPQATDDNGEDFTFGGHVIPEHPPPEGATASNVCATRGGAVESSDNLMMFTSDEDLRSVAPSPMTSLYKRRTLMMTSRRRYDDGDDDTDRSGDVSDDGGGGDEEEGSVRMPPAFVELLDSLRHRKRATRSMTMLSSGVNGGSRKKSMPQRPNSLGGLKLGGSRSSPATDTDEDLENNNEGGNGGVVGGNSTLRSEDAKATTTVAHYKHICEQLLSRFSEAEKLYYQQKIVDKKRDGHEEALACMSETFANIASRISRLDLIPPSAVARTTETVQQSEQQIESLLRHFSQQLVKIVHQQQQQQQESEKQVDLDTSTSL